MKGLSVFLFHYLLLGQYNSQIATVEPPLVTTATSLPTIFLSWVIVHKLTIV